MTNANDLIHSFNHIEATEGNFNGLTKREYFAAMAMQGLCLNKRHIDIIEGQCVDISQEAILIADALINALNQKP